MAKRGVSRRTKPTEPPVIAQANPTPEQRARSAYTTAQTINPDGATTTVTQERAADGSLVATIKVHSHTVCRRQPSWKLLHSRRCISDETLEVLEWYDSRLALARAGLTRDSLGRLDTPAGSGTGHSPVMAAAMAREDVAWARSFIKSGLGVFDDVMERELTFTEAGGEKASRQFRIAASWLLLGIGDRVLA